MSMGIVGVKSTAGRAVKCVDPSKTTRSESAWLGYPFCDEREREIYHINHSLGSLHNEERRLGAQRGLDTLVVPLITSNDGLSIAY